MIRFAGLGCFSPPRLWGRETTANGQVLPQWGLHLLRMDLAPNNLVEVVGRQPATWPKMAVRQQLLLLTDLLHHDCSTLLPGRE